ncbi:MAG: nuclear transport factor 2 family protein [Sphingomonadaceae bacterium]|nr:nuclear transport factor 2 family protein [Sphingomonadaceae bacterium]
MSTNPLLNRWLAYMEGDRAPDDLRALLAENATFHSPVVHTPQEGREKTFAYLHAADSVFADSRFEYVRQMVDGDNALLEFTAEIDGIHVNGVDIIHWDAEGLIDDFKVMVRPMKAMNKLWEMMAAQLEKQTA